MIVGIQRLLLDLSELKIENVKIQEAGGISYAIIPDFKIPAGTFAGRVINLGIPAPSDYPRAVMACIHLEANPHLVPYGATPDRNVIASGLGPTWQYWSYQFKAKQSNTTNELISQINDVFRRN